MKFFRSGFFQSNYFRSLPIRIVGFTLTAAAFKKDELKRYFRERTREHDAKKDDDFNDKIFNGHGDSCFGGAVNQRDNCDPKEKEKMEKWTFQYTEACGKLTDPTDRARRAHKILSKIIYGDSITYKAPEAEEIFVGKDARDFIRRKSNFTKPATFFCTITGERKAEREDEPHNHTVRIDVKAPDVCTIYDWSGLALNIDWTDTEATRMQKGPCEKVLFLYFLQALSFKGYEQTALAFPLVPHIKDPEIDYSLRDEPKVCPLHSQNDSHEPTQPSMR